MDASTVNVVRYLPFLLVLALATVPHFFVVFFAAALVLLVVTVLVCSFTVAFFGFAPTTLPFTVNFSPDTTGDFGACNDTE